MFWLWVFLIVVFWIAGMTFSLGVLYDYKNTGKIGEESLGTAIAHVYFAVLPAVVFVLTAIVLRIAGEVTLPTVLVSLLVWMVLFEGILAVKQFRTRKQRAESPGSGTDIVTVRIFLELVPLAAIAAIYGMWYLFYEERTFFWIAVALILFMLFVYPVAAIAVRFLRVRLFLSPADVAEELHREDREDISELPEELRTLMGPAFDFGSSETRRKYLDACLGREQSTVKGLNGWEYIEVLDDRVFRSRIDLRCFYDNGESKIVRLNWKQKKLTEERLSEEDREIIRVANAFYGVTLTGRLGYVLRCFETYLLTVMDEDSCRRITEPFWNAASADGWERHESGMPVSARNLFAGLTPEAEEATGTLFRISRELIIDHGAWLRLFERGEYVTSKAIAEATDVLRRCGVTPPDAAFPARFLFKRDSQQIKNEQKNAEAWGFGPEVRSLSLTVKQRN